MHDSIHYKRGFRVAVSKSDFTTEIELFKSGRGCDLETLQGVKLLYLGEVIDENGILTASEILQRFLVSGSDCAKKFDGSFVLVFVGHAPDSIIVITDPLNSLKCFLEETADSYVLVSSLCFLPDHSRSLDRIAVTSFLVNGVIYNNRTIYDGIRSLHRASIHIFDANKGISSQEYWTYQFDNQFIDRSSKDLKNELADLLLTAAKKRVRIAETIYLSLSGGYDSTCVLGLLSTVARGDVECFSYVVNNGSLGSDEAVAAQMAKIAGFRHSTVNVFDGDIIDLMRQNARLGECRANFCGELDAWQSIGKKMGDDAVFFVGDECFGWSGCQLKSERDVLASIPIHTANVLARYSDCVDTGALGGDYDREILHFTEAALERDLHNTKDFLYLDQRLGNVILPWRELFAGQYASVRNLLLDRNILNFMAHLPSRFRLGKNLYKETVRMMFPDLFKVKRAFKPAVDPLKIAMFTQREALENELICGHSLLDQWIEPIQCKRLLPQSRPTETFSVRARAILFGKQMLKESSVAHSLMNFLPPKPLANVAPLVLLTRIIVLRHYLKF